MPRNHTSPILAIRHISISEDASITRARRDLLRFITIIVALVLSADTLDTSEARVAERRSVAIVRIDTRANTTILRQYTIERGSPLVLRFAITTGAVELAKVADEEVGDSQCAAAIVLEDLVFCALGTTTDDMGGAGLLLNGQCICAC